MYGRGQCLKQGLAFYWSPCYFLEIIKYHIYILKNTDPSIANPFKGKMHWHKKMDAASTNNLPRVWQAGACLDSASWSAEKSRDQRDTVRPQ